MKKFMVMGLLGALCALFLAGCANNGDYYKTIAMIETAKAEAEGKRWDAVKAGLDRATPETAALAAQGIAFATGSNAKAESTYVKPPEDWLDRGLKIATALSSIGRIAVDVIDVKERGKTARQLSADNVNLERARGDTMVGLVDRAGKNAGTQITAGGDVANAASTIDKKNCSSGQSLGGAGAMGGNGAAGGSGTSTTGSSPGGAAAAGAPGGFGGQGGTTGGNCK